MSRRTWSDCKDGPTRRSPSRITYCGQEPEAGSGLNSPDWEHSTEKLEGRALDREAGTDVSGTEGACIAQHAIRQLPSNPQQQLKAGEVATDIPAAALAFQSSGGKNAMQMMPIAKRATISERNRHGKGLLRIRYSVALGRSCRNGMRRLWA